jgi:hypothetical protein
MSSSLEVRRTAGKFSVFEHTCMHAHVLVDNIHDNPEQPKYPV